MDLKEEELSKNTAPRLVRVSNFDSINQASRWRNIIDEAGFLDIDLWRKSDNPLLNLLKQAPLLRNEFAGVLRTAWLYDSRLCLTHAELFDGVFFTAFGPRQVLDFLGTTATDTPPLLILGPEASLQESLVKFHIDKNMCIGGKHHSLFDSGSFTESHQNLVHNQARLNTTDTTPEQLTHMIESAYAFPEDSLWLVGQRWSEWLDAEQQGLIEYRKFGDHKDLGSFEEQLEKSALPYKDVFQKWTSISDASYREIVTTAIRSEAVDSVIPHLQEVTAASVTEETSASLIQKCISFYAFVYQLALANQHGTDWITVKETGNLFSQFLASQSTGRRSSRIDDHHNLSKLGGEATEILGKMPTPVFLATCYKAEDAITRWRKRSGSSRRELASSTKDINFALQQASEPYDRQSGLRQLKFGAILTVLLAVASVWLDNVNDIGINGFLLVPVLSFIITVLPDAIEMIKQWWSYSKSVKTVMISYQ